MADEQSYETFGDEESCCGCASPSDAFIPEDFEAALPPKGLLQGEIEKHIKKKSQRNSAPIKADLYQMTAVGWEGTSWRWNMSTDDFLKVCGLCMIPVIQVLGPAAIMVWAIWALDWSNLEVKLPFNYEFGSDKHGISHITTRVMSTIFLYLFTLFGVATLKEDDEKLLKLRLMFYSIKDKKEEEGSCMLTVIGPLINSWVILMCALDMLLLFLLTDSPKDVLYDALGLFFLFNLDDIPGQVDALMPSWPCQTVGDLYNESLLHDWEEEGFRYAGLEKNAGNLDLEEVNDNRGSADPDAIMDNIKEIEAKYEHIGLTRNYFYRMTRWVMRPLVIMLPIAYLMLCESVKAKEV